MNKQDASDLFDQSVKRYWDDLEEGDLSNDQRQIVVNDLLVAFLRVSTTVEKLGIFSPKNETIDDIKTLDLKYVHCGEGGKDLHQWSHTHSQSINQSNHC